jgi:hypothetical protein
MKLPPAGIYHNSRQFPDLAMVIETWRNLPEYIRQTICTLVNAVRASD